MIAVWIEIVDFVESRQRGSFDESIGSADHSIVPARVDGNPD